MWGASFFHSNLQWVIVILYMSCGYSSIIFPTGKVCLGVTSQESSERGGHLILT